MAKRKLTAKQKAALARGRAKLAAKRKPVARTRRVKTMARRKRRTRTVYRTARRSYRRKSGFTQGQLYMGIGAAALAEPVVDSFAARFGFANADDFAKILLGAWAYKKQRGMFKAAGLGLMAFGTRNLVRNYTGGIMGTNTASANMGATLI